MSDAAEPSLRFRFAVNRLDRRADLRDDPAAIAGLLDRADARFLVVAGDRPLITRGEEAPPTAFLPRAAAEALGGCFDRAVFLGLAPSEGSEGAPWFAVRTRLDEDALAALADHEAADLRTLAISGVLAADEYGAIAEGRAVWPSAISQASDASTASQGRNTRRFGIARSEATCSTGWWVGPSSPTPIESWVRTWITLRPISAASRIAGRA